MRAVDKHGTVWLTSFLDILLQPNHSLMSWFLNYDNRVNRGRQRMSWSFSVCFSWFSGLGMGRVLSWVDLLLHGIWWESLTQLPPPCGWAGLEGARRPLLHIASPLMCCVSSLSHVTQASLMHGGRLPRAESRNCQTSWGLSVKVRECHFHCILLVKWSHKPSQGEEKETLPVEGWRVVHIQGGKKLLAI